MWSEAVIVACAVCFGAADGPLLTAARGGVLVMVAVTCGVLATLGAFFLRLRKGDVGLPEKGDNRHFSQKKGTTAISCEERGQPAK